MHVFRICDTASGGLDSAGIAECWPAAYFVGNLYRKRHRCRGGGICADPYPAPRSCPHSVGAGSFVAKGSGAAISTGPQRAATDTAGRCHTGRRCTLGNGGRIALQEPVCRDRRGLGRSTRAQLYRDQTPGLAVRGKWHSLLAYPARRQPRSKRGAGSLASDLAALKPASGRPQGPRRSALAGGTLPLTSHQSGRMGGQL